MIDRIVFKFVVPIDGDGTLSTYYFTTHGFRTASTDTPANTYIAERVTRAGGWRRDLFSRDRLAGPNAPSYGVVTLNNEDGVLDTFAGFSGGGGEVTAYLGNDSQAFPGGYFQIYKASIFSIVPDFDVIEIRLQDRTESLRVPIVTATFTGAGGLEGTTAAARKKQLVFGEPGLIPLIEIDRTKQIYFVQANATDYQTYAGLTEFGFPFEGGVPVDRDSPYTFSAQLVGDTDPDPGTFKAWAGYGGAFSINGVQFGTEAQANRYTKGPLYVRLGTPPVSELRFGALGLLANRREDPRRWRFTDLCNRAGMRDVTPATLATVAGLTEDFDCGNRLIDGDQTYLEVMSDRCAAVLGACGFDRLDRFWCATLRDPTDGTEASAYTFDITNSNDFSRAPLKGMERPVWQVNVKAGRTWPATPLEAASSEMRDLLTRQPWAVQFSGTSQDVKTAYPNAVSFTMEVDGNDFKTTEQQQAFVDAFGILYGTLRDHMQLTCLRFDSTTLALGLLDRVTLQVARFGYDAGILMRIISIEVDMDADPRSIRFGLWGNNSGFEHWQVGGGTYPAGAGEPGGSWGPSGPPDSALNDEQLSALLEDFYSEFYAAMVQAVYGETTLDDAEQESAMTFVGGGLLGLVVYEAEDQAPGGVVTSGPAAAKTSFLARLTVSGEETFEDAPWEDAYAADGATSTINGVTVTYSDPAATGNLVTTIANNGRFNTTAAPAQSLFLEAGGAAQLVTVTFTTPIAAFGAYFTDVGDFAGQVSATLHVNGGGTVSIDLTHTVNGSSGALMFWGFVDDTDTYDSIDFLSTSAAEAIGIDDIVVATDAQLS